jgi:hypothetical protein
LRAVVQAVRHTSPGPLLPFAPDKTERLTRRAPLGFV